MTNPASFHDLPEYLQAKILGPDKINLVPLTPLQRELNEKMNLTITPGKYRSVVALGAEFERQRETASASLPPITNRGVTGG